MEDQGSAMREKSGAMGERYAMHHLAVWYATENNVLVMMHFRIKGESWLASLAVQKEKQCQRILCTYAWSSTLRQAARLVHLTYAMLKPKRKATMQAMSTLGINPLMLIRDNHGNCHAGLCITPTPPLAVPPCCHVSSLLVHRPTSTSLAAVGAGGAAPMNERNS